MLVSSMQLRQIVKLQNHVGRVCYSSVISADAKNKQRKLTVIDPDPSEFIAPDQVRYPAVQPKFPPSKWSYGSTSRKTAWEFQSRADSLRLQPTVFEKAFHFNHLEAKDNFYEIQLPYTMPNSLNFVQHLTRTHVIGPQNVTAAEGNDTKPVTKSGFSDLLKSYLSDPAVEEISKRALPLVLESARRLAKQTDSYDKVIEDVLDSLVLAINVSKQQITSAAKSAVSQQVFEELEQAQIAHSGRFQTFWRRSGFDSVPEIDLKQIYSMSEYLKKVRKRIRDDFGHARFTLQAETSWQMRSPLPMYPLFAGQLFFSGESGEAAANNGFESLWKGERKVLTQTESAAHDPGLYFDLPHQDIHTFWHIQKQHFARLHEMPRLGRNVPGFWPRSPFWPSDPAEFPSLAVLPFDSRPFGDTYGEQRVADIARTNALLTAFGWCSAAAFNQGYTMYDDMDYPISAFAVAFDNSPRRRTVSICGYQLNSLSGLWKAADCGDPFNVACFSDSAPLFELDSTTQKVSVNESVVRQLVAALLQSGKKIQVDPSTDLSPFVRQRSPVLPVFPFERTKSTGPNYALEVRELAAGEDAATSDVAASTANNDAETEPNDLTYSFGVHPSCVGVPSRLWRTWINVKGETPFAARLSEPPSVLKRRWTARVHPNERYYAKRSDPRDILFDVRRTYPSLRIPVKLMKIKNPEQKYGSKRFRENLELAKREASEPHHKVIIGDWSSRGRV